MVASAQAKMTFDEFLTWPADGDQRYELVEGVPMQMAPERAGHARMKVRVHRAVSDALSAAGLDCEAFMDGMTVRVDEHNAYEPDVVVQCGARLPDDAIVVPDPVVVVEVLSPSTRGRDAGAKLDDYFRLPSVAHYLLVKTERFSVIHHARQPDGTVKTSFATTGELRLDPPGIVFSLEALR